MREDPSWFKTTSEKRFRYSVILRCASPMLRYAIATVSELLLLAPQYSTPTLSISTTPFALEPKSTKRFRVIPFYFLLFYGMVSLNKLKNNNNMFFNYDIFHYLTENINNILKNFILYILISHPPHYHSPNITQAISFRSRFERFSYICLTTNIIQNTKNKGCLFFELSVLSYLFFKILNTYY